MSSQSPCRSSRAGCVFGYFACDAHATLVNRTDTGRLRCCRSCSSHWQARSRSSCSAFATAGRHGFATLALRLIVTVSSSIHRSGRRTARSRGVHRHVRAAPAGGRRAGWVGARSNTLLQMRRPSFNFGHARWREREREMQMRPPASIAALRERCGRPPVHLRRCFNPHAADRLGSGQHGSSGAGTRTSRQDCVATVTLLPSSRTIRRKYAHTEG